MFSADIQFCGQKNQKGYFDGVVHSKKEVCMSVLAWIVTGAVVWVIIGLLLMSYVEGLSLNWYSIMFYTVPAPAFRFMTFWIPPSTGFARGSPKENE
jgi:hypothetical protein